MRNKTAALFSALLFCTGWITVTAQQVDSSRLDIGYLTLDKNLTQHLTVRGEDLEKMPFVNLSDAISAWFFGAYSQPANLAYVVDGNPVADVNSYPIFDIAEVTLVEQAAGAAGYGGSQQELVLVTTKRGKGRHGFRATGQVGLVNGDGNGYKTFDRVYHQYYAGVYQNTDKVSYGLSADWVRDVMPEFKGDEDEVSTPYDLQRWRLNGYLEWRPAKGQVVEVRLGYAPQTERGASDSFPDIFDENTRHMHADGHLVSPQLRWQGTFLRGLTNELRGVYVGMSNNYALYATDTSFNGGSTFHGGELNVNKNSQMFVRDRLSWDLAAGSWHVIPAVNFSYEHIDEQTAVGILTESYNSFGYLIPSGIYLGPMQEQKGNLAFLTPGVEIRWRSAIDVQAGVQYNLSARRDSAARTVFPYVALGIDVLHFGRRAGGPSLKLFGSYTQRPMDFVDDYSQIDLMYGGGQYSLANVYHPTYKDETLYTITTYPPDTTTTLVREPIQQPPVFWIWEAGISFATTNGRLQAQYNFERRNFSTIGNTLANGATAYFLESGSIEWRSVQHHIDVRYRVVDNGKLSWLTGINATAQRSTLHDVLVYYYYFPKSGDLSPNPLSWTGGWVNRLEMGNFSAGLDLLYHFGQRVLSSPIFGVNWTKLNSALSPNLYAAYRWKLRGARTVQLFVDCRGLVRSKSNDLLDDRRYYTVGGNFSL